MNSKMSIYVERASVQEVTLNLTPQERALVRLTWNEMLSLSDDSVVDRTQYKTQFCNQLYKNLLGLQPDLELVFPSIKHLANAFAGVVHLALLNLENMSAMDDYLDSLGKRHLRILGVEPEQYDMMGVALMRTFADRFGNKFTVEIEDVWIKVYAYLANTMLQNGNEDVMILTEEYLNGEDDFAVFEALLSISLYNNNTMDTISVTLSSISGDTGSVKSAKGLLKMRARERLALRKLSYKNLREADMVKLPSSRSRLSTRKEESEVKKRFGGLRSAIGLEKRDKRLSTVY